MARFLAARVLQLVPVLVIASIGVWGLIYLLPGNPAIVLLGPNASPAQIAAETRLLGLDRPAPLQYLIWLGHVLTGDFGVSYISRLPVTSLIGPRALASVQLTVCSFVVALAIGIPAGVAAARRSGGMVARLVSWYNSLTLAIPTFWLGILLILVFGVSTHMLPTSSQFIPVWDDPLGALQALALPSLNLGLYVSGIIARFTRAAMESALRSDYIQLARAKGLTERSVVWHHALRNALLPTITVVGLQFGAFIGGTVITEAVFDYPGMGTLVLNSLLQRDYSTLQASILLLVVAFVAVNLVVDVLYALLDPRIRYG